MGYPCTKCTKSFHSSTALQQHISSPAHVHSCTYDNCGRSFISKQALQQHMLSTGHASPLTCKCGKAFGSLEALNQHQNSTVHNSKPKNTLNTASKKGNVQQDSTQSSVRTISHTRNKSSISKHDLQRHAKPVVHAPVRCPICKRSFCDQNALRQHMTDAPFHATHYKNPLLREAAISNPGLEPSHPDRLPKYDCHLCTKTFKNNQALHMHLASTVHAPSNIMAASQTPPSSKQAAPLPVVSATQTHLHYCIGCQKDFKSTEALQSHLSSPIHVHPQTDQVTGLSLNNWQEFCKSMQTVLEMRVSNINTSNPTAGKATQTYRSVGIQVQDRNNAPLALNHANILRPVDPVVYGALSSEINTRTTVENATKTFLYGKNRWSIIPAPEQQLMLNALAKHCHSLDDLANHKYFPSIRPDGTKIGRPTFGVFCSTPSNASGIPKRAAVALDCEMVGVKGGGSELALLSAVDYITGEVLINTFIYPKEKVVDWRTRFSGISASAMNLAKSEGRTLNGWEDARAELWKYIDTRTILVGHSLQHDLDVLRMIHTSVVDSAILAKNAVGAGITRQWGLKTLCKEFLNIQIQDHGKKGHDCLEDTYATREVVLWCVKNKAEFKAWGNAANAEEQRKLEERKAKKKERDAKKQNRQKDAAKPRVVETFNDFYDSGEVEYLRWEDIAADFGYPEYYDPWSD